MKIVREGEGGPSRDDQAAVPGNGAANPLDALAGRIEGDQAADGPADPQQAAQLAEAEAAFKKMMAGLGVFAGKALRAVRSRIGKGLPEIHEHWTDADLAGVADALPPVAAKWLGRLGPLMGEYPEECMLILAAAPLVAGYVGAVSDHADKGEPRQLAAAGPAIVATAPAPTATPVHRVG